MKEFSRKAQNALFKEYSVEKVRKYFKEDYIQHNPHVPTGRAPIEGFVPALEKAGTTSVTHRLIQDGNFIIMHNSYDNAEAFGAKEIVTFDIWRIEGNQIAEHWDAITPLPAEKNQSGRTIIDGATEITDRDKTDANKKLVRSFYHDVFVKGDKSAAKKYISDKKYIQHGAKGKDVLKHL